MLIVQDHGKEFIVSSDDLGTHDTAQQLGAKPLGPSDLLFSTIQWWKWPTEVAADLTLSSCPADWA
jgi:hypothetical protein